MSVHKTISFKGLTRTEARARMVQAFEDVWTSCTETAMTKAAQAGATDDTLAGLAEYRPETRDASIDAIVNDIVPQLGAPDGDSGPTSVHWHAGLVVWSRRHAGLAATPTNLRVHMLPHALAQVADRLLGFCRPFPLVEVLGRASDN